MMVLYRKSRPGAGCIKSQRHQSNLLLCVGANVQKHHDIYARILAEGHGVATTPKTISGWTVANEAYLQEIEEAANTSIALFFVRLWPDQSIQYAQIKDRYKVIMWDTLLKAITMPASVASRFTKMPPPVKAELHHRFSRQP